LSFVFPVWVKEKPAEAGLKWCRSSVNGGEAHPRLNLAFVA
jgi:hypothetical protein